MAQLQEVITPPDTELFETFITTKDEVGTPFKLWIPSIDDILDASNKKVNAKKYSEYAQYLKLLESFCKRKHNNEFVHIDAQYVEADKLFIVRDQPNSKMHFRNHYEVLKFPIDVQKSERVVKTAQLKKIWNELTNNYLKYHIIHGRGGSVLKSIDRGQSYSGNYYNDISTNNRASKKKMKEEMNKIATLIANVVIVGVMVVLKILV